VTDRNAIAAAAELLRRRLSFTPDVAVVLGSGLGGFASAIEASAVVPYSDIPHWPATQAIGHPGTLTAGRLRGRGVLALAGRAHLYDGHAPAAVAFSVRVVARLGVRVIVLTNAAGAINERFSPGALMVIDDHLNLMGANPLTGPNDAALGPRFPDMSEVYSRRLRRLADAAAAQVAVAVEHGVYAAVAGPSYETPAEIRALRMLGADAVGMSTVPEAIAARHMGLEVLGISCITNMAAGILPEALSADEVVAVAARVERPLTALLEEIVERL
jgi:purine-nucleoside phosphorylase